MPAFRPAAFCQSVVPNAVGLVARSPSPPAKVLPASGPEQDCVVPVAAKSHPLGLSAKAAAGMDRPIATAAAAAITRHRRLARRIRKLPRPPAPRPAWLLRTLIIPPQRLDYLTAGAIAPPRPGELLARVTPPAHAAGGGHAWLTDSAARTPRPR